MAKKKTTIESMIVKELTKKSTPKKSISKKSSSTSAKQKRSEIAKNIQNEAKERLVDTLLKKPRSKKAQKLRLLYIFLLLIVIGVSGFFAYEEI
ncbi:MAG: hypothetical protein PHY42_03655, partial [Bacilli bacterium]|nr:hypothetical protein [Bacilli bacterium]